MIPTRPTEPIPQPTDGLIASPPNSQPAPDLPGFEHRFETVDGVRLHYVTGGKAEGEMVVLLAGFPESWFAWRKVMALLATDYRIIAPDLPGQGDSDRPPSGYPRPPRFSRRRSRTPPGSSSRAGTWWPRLTRPSTPTWNACMLPVPRVTRSKWKVPVRWKAQAEGKTPFTKQGESLR